MQVSESPAIARGHMPTECPWGHPLGPGQVLAGWLPCQCPPALEVYRGHGTYHCETCLYAGWQTVSYQPPHVPADGTRGQHPVH